MNARPIHLVIVCLGLASCERPKLEPLDSAGAERMPSTSLADVDAAQAIAAEAFAALSGRLLQTIKERGHVAAIDVCAMEATDLLQSVADSRKVTMRRVTDRPRNRANQADEMDLAVMGAMQSMMKSDGMVKPIVDGSTVRLPISIGMPLCLTCHGDPQRDIPAETLQAIHQRYPQDRATGYRADELRGIWRVEFSQPAGP